MNQQCFIELAGGVYTHHKFYSSLSRNNKFDLFWSFFTSDYSYVKSVYAGIEIDILQKTNKHSIEHIFPQSTMKKYLAMKKANVNVIKGATVNPLNFAAAHKKVNSHRGHLTFDIENDTVIHRLKLSVPHNYTDFGIDYENEWIVPHVSRGNIARTMLYMMLVYNIQELHMDHLHTYRYWAKCDPPEVWEIEYNAWVLEKHHISNLFVTDDIEQMVKLLDDDHLFQHILCNK
ncbi:endonuclease [Cytobacillus sp. IB215665]|uniref:endonuclease n=1 Tax=Cytobacillus sp. IB215665 TaxID=3097357 RepID=UPI002A0B0FF0|nr:endonuclease [Cytobacillus sp. IB215665]MDX8366525.1 endonuclease [Cytobacillus sp. IB215665]